MKYQESCKRYVDDIIRELPLSPYTSRFREELLEHIEDAEEDLNNWDGTNILEKAMKKIGDKDKLVKSYYEDFYKSYRATFWPAGLFIYCLLTIPVFSGTLAILNAHEKITDASLWIFKIAIIVLSCLLGYVLNRALFGFVAKRLSFFSDGKKIRTIAAIMLIIFPALLLPFTILFSLHVIHENNNVWDIDASLNLINSMLTFAIMLIADGNALGVISRQSRKDFANKDKIPYILLGILLAIMVGTLMLARHTADTLSVTWQLLDVFAVFLTMPTRILSTTFPFPFLINFQLFAILLVISAITGFWYIFTAPKTKTIVEKNRRIAGGMALIAYAAFILLPIDKMRDPKTGINWHVPIINAGQEIEKKQYGNLYFASEYFIGEFPGNNTQGICQKDNLFTVVKTYDAGNEYFLLDVNDAPAGQFPVISIGKDKNPEQCTAPDFMTEDTLPQGFGCPNCEKSNGESYTSVLTEGTIFFLYSVKLLTYNGHEILNADPAIQITNIKISDNKNWALIAIEGKGTANDIYLIDLRNLK